MAKFVYLQDVHLKGINPSSRNGDYCSDILTKLEEVLELSSQLEVDFIIDGGDFFDSSLISNTIIDDVLDKIENKKIKWYMLYGNHCLIGHSVNNSKGSSLTHVFRRSKYVEHLTNISTDIDSSFIQGFEYYHNIEEDIKDKGLYCPSQNSKTKIAITHAFITLKPFRPDVLHVVAKDIKTDFDIVLCAHYHEPWGIKEINGTKFINIGCFGRTSINEANVKPSILLVNTEPKLTVQILNLKSAKPKEEVFNLDRIEKAKEFNEDIENFINSLKDTKISGLDLRGIIENIAKEKNIDRNIVDEVIERIGTYEI